MLVTAVSSALLVLVVALGTLHCRHLYRRRDRNRTNTVGRCTALALCAAILVAGCSSVAPVPARPRPPAPTSPLLTVGYWQQKYDTDLAATSDDSLALSRSPDSWSFYELAYSLDELTNMFEATGDRAYADRALSYVDNMLASARPSSSFPASGFRDGYLGWVSNQNGETGDEVALYESYSWRYVVRLLRVLKQRGLADDARYRDRFQRILAFSERDIFDKWSTRGADEYVYRSRTHTAAHWAFIALDLSVLTTDDTRRAGYRRVVENIDRHLPNYPSSLRGQLRPSGASAEAYRWSDVWGERSSGAQDIGHGNGVISYVVEARDLGSSEWTEEDLARFTGTLTAFVVGDGSGTYPEYVDGSGRGNGWIADGFVKLGRYDPAVQAMLQDYGVQNMQFYAAMAANARILAVRPDARGGG